MLEAVIAVVLLCVGVKLIKKGARMLMCYIADDKS